MGETWLLSIVPSVTQVVTISCICHNDLVACSTIFLSFATQHVKGLKNAKKEKKSNSQFWWMRNIKK
jgi:hypothetical protein